MKNTKRIHRLIAAILALVMMFAFSACSSNEPTPEEVMAKAQENLNNVSSVRVDMTADVGMTFLGESVAMITTVKGEQFVDPMKVKMTSTIDMGEILEPIESEIYIVSEDGMIVCYTGTDIGGTKMWQKMNVMDEAELMQYNAADTAAFYTEHAESISVVGTEDVNGISATRYDAVIPNDYIVEVMNASGSVDQFKALGMTEEEFISMFEDAGDIPMSIWISEDTMPVKYEIDMTKMMQALFDSMFGSLMNEDAEAAVETEADAVADTDATAETDAEVSAEDKALLFTIDKMVITMYLSDFDAVEDFDIPTDEFANAIDITNADIGMSLN